MLSCHMWPINTRVLDKADLIHCFLAEHVMVPEGPEGIDVAPNYEQIVTFGFYQTFFKKPYSKGGSFMN